MLTPFRWYWSKILPISYNDYISHTEILNAVCDYLNRLNAEVVKIQNFIDTDLPSFIEDEVKKSLSDVFAQIEDLRGLINSLNVELENSIKMLTAKLETELAEMDKKWLAKFDSQMQIIDNFMNAINIRIDTLERNHDTDVALIYAKMEQQSMSLRNLISSYYSSLVNFVKNHFDKISRDNIKVTSPISGKEVSLQEALWDVAGMFAKTPSMAQFEGYNLTMKEFEGFHMTMRDYWLCGRPIIERWLRNRVEKIPRHMDIYGNYRRNTAQSAYVLTDGTPPPDLYNITATQFDSISNRVGGYEVDRRGRYWLANIGSSVYRDVIHLRADTVATTHFGMNHLSVLLKPDIDITDGSIDTQDILNDNSVDKLMLNVKIECPKYDSGYVQYFTGVPTLVAGGIALDIDINNQTYDADDDPCTVLADITALTTTY